MIDLRLDEKGNEVSWRKSSDEWVIDQVIEKLREFDKESKGNVTIQVNFGASKELDIKSWFEVVVYNYGHYRDGEVRA